MGFFRSNEAEAVYKAHRASLPPDAPCPLCSKETIEHFTHWRIIPNTFPYDKIAKTHHMIVPKRHCTELELTEEEKQELFQLKNEYCNEHYEYIIEAVTRRKSLPKHFHLHLVVVKD